MKNRFINLRLFAEESASASSVAAAEGTEGNTAKAAEPVTVQPKAAEEPKAKYTDEDVNKLLNQKFAEWQKKQEKQTSEAERLGRMTAEEKANERMKALEDKLREYELNAARAEMTAQARIMLQDKNINVSDSLLANLIAEDADSTKKSVDAFAKLFNEAVEKKVKEAVKGETPRTGAPSGMTKEQIMKVSNRTERQRLIKENMHLFK